MRRGLVRLAAIFNTVALVLAGWTTASAASFPVPLLEQARDLVVVEVSHTRMEGGWPDLRILDSTGKEVWRWPVGDRFAAQPVVVAGAPGIFFVSFGPGPDGSDPGTTIYAISIADSAPARIGTIDGSAALVAVTDDGASLLLRASTDDHPTGTAELPIPMEWQGPPAHASRFDRVAWDQTPEAGFRVLGFDRDKRLVVTDIRPDEEPITRDLGNARLPNYWSLLLSPDGATAFVIDFGEQTVEAIDVDRRSVVGSFASGRKLTKMRTCGTALSPSGDRLYAIGRSGNVPDGIDVLDTATMQRVANWLPRHAATCLAVSPDGEQLYVFSIGSIAVVDTVTGEEIGTLPLASLAEDPWPLLIAGAG
jgi:hypothetical protein